MNIIPQKLTLDINRDVCFQVLVVKQGDRGSRFIEITLTADGQKLELGTIASGAVFSASLKGVLVQNETFKIDASTHTVTVTLSDNALAESGVLDCELSAVNAENEKVTSATFYVSVAASTKGKLQYISDMLENIVETKMLKDRAVTGIKIADEEIGDEHLINKYWKTNRTSIILREGFLHDFIIQNSSELAKPFDHIYIILNKGYDGLDCIGVGSCLGMFADADKFVVYNMITGKSCVVTFTAEEIVSVEEIISNKADQEYNSKSENAQSGIAVAQAVAEGKDFVNLGEITDIKRLDLALSQNNYDENKVYRFSFVSDIYVNDAVISGTTAYIGYITNTERYGLAIEFEPIISDGVKRIVGFGSEVPNVYDYWEEPIITVDVKQDFVNLGSIDTLDVLTSYGYALDKVYRIEVATDLDEAIPKGVYIGRYYVKGSEYLELTAFVPDGYIRNVNLDTGKCSKISVNDTDPNRHAEYFEITDDGELSLKPEYRGATSNSIYTASISDMGEGVAGSRNSELPADLVIPEVVNDMAVDRLSSGIFLDNTSIECVTFPITVEDIPEHCFNQAYNLKALKNTEHIKRFGERSFRACRLEKVAFPNLEEITGPLAFSNNPHLIYADIGKVVTVYDKTFKLCNALTKVCGENITEIGSEAFYCTPRLTNLNFIKNLTAIGKGGFWISDIDYDWDSMKNCSFADYATHRQTNPTDFWSSVAFESCENPLPTFLCQRDDRWKDREISNGIYYGASGCSVMSSLHIYCGLNNLTLTSVEEFEDIVKSRDTTLWNLKMTQLNNVETLLNGIGLKATLYSSWNKSGVTALYNTLKNGGYAIVSQGMPSGHAIVVYGIDEKGELLCADSEKRYYYDSTKGSKYKMPFHKCICNNSQYILVEGG